MSNVHVNRNVFDAVKQSVETGRTQQGGREIDAEEIQRIENEIVADGDLSGDESHLLSALRYSSTVHVTDGIETIELDPLSIRFPGQAQVSQHRDIEMRANERLAQIPPTQGSGSLPVMTPQEILRSAPDTLDIASRFLDTGNSESAAAHLASAAQTIRGTLPQAQGAERMVLEELANNFDARAHAYRQSDPDSLQAAAGSLYNVYGRNAVLIGESLAESNPEYSELMLQVGRDSRIQAEIMYQSGANTKSMLGLGVSQTYRAIVDASFAKDIANTGTLNNLITGSRDDLERDRTRMTEVFDFMDRKMQDEGLTFHEAWSDMFDDARVASSDALPSFATARQAAMFLRDHESSRGLLSHFSQLSRGLADGEDATVDRARGQLVEALRENDQWDIARQVLDDFQANTRTSEGSGEAQRLNDNESREWWTAKALQFAQEDLPVLLLSGVVSGGAGLGARALAGAAGWGSRAARAAQVTTELATFVPVERVLNDVINGRRADWSGGAMARDFALTAGSYGLFRALGAGWRALRSPKTVQPSQAANAANRPSGNATPVPRSEAPENIAALTRENQSAQTLARNGYRIEQNPRVPGIKNPDYRIEGHIFDNYAPSSSNPRNIWSNVQGKVEAEQARRIVLNLDDSRVGMEALERQFADWPIEGLEQVLVIRNGQVSNLALPRSTSSTPWVTPGLYPHQEQDSE